MLHEVANLRELQNLRSVIVELREALQAMGSSMGAGCWCLQANDPHKPDASHDGRCRMARDAIRRAREVV